MSRVVRKRKTGLLPMRKTKAQISFAVNAKLISAFDFATRIVGIPLLSKSEISSLKASACIDRFVSDLVENPEDRFSHGTAQII